MRLGLVFGAIKTLNVKEKGENVMYEDKKDIPQEEVYANMVIKAMMIDLDLGYNSEEIEAISEDAYAKKQALRSKIFRTIHEIAKLTKYHK
jgi:hypothetical protein